MTKHLFKILCLAAAMAFSASGAAFAHEIWAIAENPEPGKNLVAVLGYGHAFPHGEEIAAERLPIFYPLEVVDSSGAKPALKPGDVTCKSVTEKPFEKGSYLILTGYKPTYWSYTPAGSVMKPKNEAEGATSCEQYSRSAKGVVNVGGAADDFVVKPVGAKLEIVPLVNPGKIKIKVGQELALQVLYDGAPLKQAAVKGAIEGNKLAEEGNRDFYAQTDKDGKLVMIPIKAGWWTLAVEVRSDYPDKTVCDDLAGDAALTFLIAD
jgi:uncharacterized GH25 family protein